MKIQTGRSIAYLAAVLILAIALNYPRIGIAFMKVPEQISAVIKRPARVIVVYGNPCTACRSGEFLLSLSDSPKKRMNIFVFPTAFTQIDIDNLKTTFGLEGVMIRSDEAVDECKRRTSKYLKTITQSTGFYIEIGSAKLISKLSTF
jgi:hypothetical protein